MAAMRPSEEPFKLWVAYNTSDHASNLQYTEELFELIHRAREVSSISQHQELINDMLWLGLGKFENRHIAELIIMQLFNQLKIDSTTINLASQPLAEIYERYANILPTTINLGSLQKALSSASTSLEREMRELKSRNMPINDIEPLLKVCDYLLSPTIDRRHLPNPQLFNLLMKNRENIHSANIGTRLASLMCSIFEIAAHKRKPGEPQLSYEVLKQTTPPVHADQIPTLRFIQRFPDKQLSPTWTSKLLCIECSAALEARHGVSFVHQAMQCNPRVIALGGLGKSFRGASISPEFEEGLTLEEKTALKSSLNNYRAYENREAQYVPQSAYLVSPEYTGPILPSHLVPELHTTDSRPTQILPLTENYHPATYEGFLHKFIVSRRLACGSIEQILSTARKFWVTTKVSCM